MKVSFNPAFKGAIIIPGKEIEGKLNNHDKAELMGRCQKIKAEGNVRHYVPSGKGGCLGLFFETRQKQFELNAAHAIPEEFGVKAYHYEDMSEKDFKYITGMSKPNVKVKKPKKK